MKPFYIADGIIQGILTVICTVDITLLLCNVALFALLVRAEKWLPIHTPAFTDVLQAFTATSTFLLLPGLILAITVLSIRRSIITLREEAVSLRLQSPCRLYENSHISVSPVKARSAYHLPRIP
ncbi:hypothetical protein [Chitinophaga polysaccharea]|uniref:hypothetical protein n=1 Tax=Chitinophaga polysaccharea TaxID=1293035 RepID=UPI001159C3F0|nr:hypothetical protein [Chitinophaga polysaccharea]